MTEHPNSSQLPSRVVDPMLNVDRGGEVELDFCLNDVVVTASVLVLEVELILLVVVGSSAVVVVSSVIVVGLGLVVKPHVWKMALQSEQPPSPPPPPWKHPRSRQASHSDFVAEVAVTSPVVVVGELLLLVVAGTSVVVGVTSVEDVTSPVVLVGELLLLVVVGTSVVVGTGLVVEGSGHAYRANNCSATPVERSAKELTRNTSSGLLAISAISSRSTRLDTPTTTTRTPAALRLTAAARTAAGASWDFPSTIRSTTWGMSSPRPVGTMEPAT